MPVHFQSYRRLLFADSNHLFPAAHRTAAPTSLAPNKQPWQLHSSKRPQRWDTLSVFQVRLSRRSPPTPRHPSTASNSRHSSSRTPTSAPVLTRRCMRESTRCRSTIVVYILDNWLKRSRRRKFVMLCEVVSCCKSSTSRRSTLRCVSDRRFPQSCVLPSDLLDLCSLLPSLR